MSTYQLTNPKWNEKEIILKCECRFTEHQIHFSYMLDNELDQNEFIAIQPYLTTLRNPFKRVWYAIKYVFGYKSRFGAFDEVLAYKDDVEKLVEFLKGYLEQCQ